MSKPPQTDIVMEVARAADPERAAAVAERLNALASRGAASAQDFTSALNEIQRPSPVRPAITAPVSREAKAERQFESVVLSQFIGEMLPKDTPSAFGQGYAGDMWRSMLAERVADQIAASGRLGIAHRLFAQHPVEGSAPLFSPARGHQAGEAHVTQTSANPLSSASGAHIENGAVAFAKAKQA